MYGVAKFGVTQLGENEIINNELVPYIPNLLIYLPPTYQDILEIREIQNSVAPEIGKVKYSVDDIINQVFLEEATWGLERWERDLALETDISKPDYFRRERIKAKLKGTATTTKNMIKSIAETFSGAEVDVIEHNEQHSFTINFVGVKGIPPNMAGLIDAIDEIKPAHLVYDFTYTYTWWETLKSANLTWNGANHKTWQELKTY